MKPFLQRSADGIQVMIKTQLIVSELQPLDFPFNGHLKHKRTLSHDKLESDTSFLASILLDSFNSTAPTTWATSREEYVLQPDLENVPPSKTKVIQTLIYVCLLINLEIPT